MKLKRVREKMGLVLILLSASTSMVSIAAIAENEISIVCRQSGAFKGLGIRIRSATQKPAIIVPWEIEIFDKAGNVIDQTNVGSSTSFEVLKDTMQPSRVSISATTKSAFTFHGVLYSSSIYRLTIDQNTVNSRTTYSLGLGTSDCVCTIHAYTFEDCTVSDSVKKKFTEIKNHHQSGRIKKQNL